MEGEMPGWELLHGSDTDSIESHLSDGNSRNLPEIDGVPTSMIRSDYFSIDSLTNLPGSEKDLVELNELLADSSADQSAESQRSDARERSELGYIDGSNGEKEPNSEILGESGSDEATGVAEELGESHDSSKCWSDSGEADVGNEMALVSKTEESSESDCRIVSAEEIKGSEGSSSTEQEEPEMDSGSERQERRRVWWKMPFVLLKYYALKIGPVWSVSVAAGVIGLTLLGRRLYNMKKKAQRFQLKVAVNDKKVVKVMGLAARLNETFTEVRRVPVIRPALPAPATIPWPIMSIR